MLREIFDNKRIQYIVFFIFIAAIIGGSVYCAMLGDNEFSSVKEYFTSYINSSINKEALLKNALISNISLGIIIMICGMFKAGAFIAPAAVFREGFNTGFCIAGLCRCFGFSGAVIGGASQLHLMLFIPLMVITVSLSIKICFDFKENQKNFKIFFVFFQIFMITIFCGFAFFQTYVNTIFMKFAIVKLIK